MNLEQIKQRHQRVDLEPTDAAAFYAETGLDPSEVDCATCSCGYEDWPCDAASLVARVEELEAALRDAAEVLRSARAAIEDEQMAHGCVA